MAIGCFFNKELVAIGGFFIYENLELMSTSLTSLAPRCCVVAHYPTIMDDTAKNTRWATRPNKKA